MKKIINITLMVALAFALSGANALAVDVTTGLTQVQAGGDAPIVKAKWEMLPTKQGGNYKGEDDSTEAGAQIMPTGVKDQNRTIAICAIVTDSDGMGDVNGVYADVYYPTDPTQANAPIELGPSHTALQDQSGDGCSQFMQQDTMTELSLEKGLELFCDRIKNNNNNLPTFNPNGPGAAPYDYDDICGDTGELMKLDAKVYCVEKNLSYEDPAGDYKVIAVAQDTNSLTGTLENSFEYLPLTAFEADFTHVSYGNVKLNINKIAKGDKTWGTADLPTVRNVGNTRMNLTVNQDDMGLGMSSGNWNVMFDARVGSSVSHQSYEPNVTTTLDDALDLSEMDEVDFSILVTKFPTGNPTTSWSGNITLGAVTAPHLLCSCDYSVVPTGDPYIGLYNFTVTPVLVTNTDCSQVNALKTEKAMSFQQGQPAGQSAGWAGAGCVESGYPNVIGGGIWDGTVMDQGPAEPGATAISGFDYPNYPHYSYPAGEEGWVVHAAGPTPPTGIYAICAPLAP